MVRKSNKMLDSADLSQLTKSVLQIPHTANARILYQHGSKT